MIHSKFSEIIGRVRRNYIGSLPISILLALFTNLLHLLENTFDRKRISTNPDPNPISNPKAQ